MNKIFLILIIFASSIFSFGQINLEREIEKFSCSGKAEKVVREYFEQYENQQNFITQCELENEEKRNFLNLPKPKKISHLGPGPVSLVKPYYPKFAKQQRISGEVLVEVFTDEKGIVIYSKILKGNAFLRESVRPAACQSKFTPILYCEKPTKSRWLIRYNFTSN